MTKHCFYATLAFAISVLSIGAAPSFAAAQEEDGSGADAIVDDQDAIMVLEALDSAVRAAVHLKNREAASEVLTKTCMVISYLLSDYIMDKLRDHSRMAAEAEGYLDVRLEFQDFKQLVEFEIATVRQLVPEISDETVTWIEYELWRFYWDNRLWSRTIEIPVLDDNTPYVTTFHFEELNRFVCEQPVPDDENAMKLRVLGGIRFLVGVGFAIFDGTATVVAVPPASIASITIGGIIASQGYHQMMWSPPSDQD